MAKKKDKTLYTDDSIISLNPREFTRLCTTIAKLNIII